MIRKVPELKTVCETNQCAGCMACVEVCPRNAIRIEDSLVAFNATITDACIDCGACHRVCQWNHPAAFYKPMVWYQGWAKKDETRKEGSSGGFAAALAELFIRDGGYVCSCVFENGRFGFTLVNRTEELNRFAGSKYVKSNPEGAYKAIRERLKEGDKVLFIGLPCQVSALRNFVGQKLADNLVTVDLICHGTPSLKILEQFLKQYGIELDDCKEIKFRTKGKFRLEKDSHGFSPVGVSDRYLTAFLSALTYTENCYDCQYAKLERVSDITLGDSWGSELESEWKKGISLILCQTEKGKSLVEGADLVLHPVDLNTAVQHNHQLEHPSRKPQGRDAFFQGLQDNMKFNRLVYKALPKKCFKQDLKGILIKAHILRGGGMTYRLEIVHRDNEPSLSS